MKLKSHLVAGIFGTINFVCAFIGFILLINGSVQNNFDFRVAGTGLLLLFVAILAGIGVFVSGIIEIVQASKTENYKGFGISAGIINIVSSITSLIPFIGWAVPIVGMVFAYVSYFKNN